MRNFNIFWKILIYFSLIFLILFIWLALVFIGKYYFHSEASAQQFLLWIITAIIIFAAYPFFSFLLLSKWNLRKRKLKGEFPTNPKMKKSDWALFVILHLIGISILFWTFSDLQHHLDLYKLAGDYFGRDSRGRPLFSVVLILNSFTTFLFLLPYFIYVRIKYKTFNEPKFQDTDDDNNFRMKRKVYFSFGLSTLLTIFLSALGKMVFLM